MIRYYKKEDIEQIAKIIDEDWKIVYRGIIDEEYLEKLNYKDREKRIRSKYEKEKAIVYIEDNVVKGFCRFGESRDEGEGLGEIYALYVKLDNIKKGIGKTLVERAMKIFREKGYKEIVIWCLKENKNASQFYEKIGGKFYKGRKFKIGDKYYDEISYKYRLGDD